MRTDYDHWEPISVSDAVRILLKSLLIGISPEAGHWIYIWGADQGTRRYRYPDPARRAGRHLRKD